LGHSKLNAGRSRGRPLQGGVKRPLDSLSLRDGCGVTPGKLEWLHRFVRTIPNERAWFTTPFLSKVSVDFFDVANCCLNACGRLLMDHSFNLWERTSSFGHFLLFMRKSPLS